MENFTQEQIDSMIAEKVNEARKGLFTQEDLEKRVTSEVDRRVESGIQKGLETQRQKWEREFAEKAKLSAEELAKKELDEKIKGLSNKEVEINRKANLIEAKDMLSEAHIPKSQYDKIITMLVTDDAEQTKSNVQNFISMFSETKTEIETKIKSEFSSIKPPKQGEDKPLTKEAFLKMSYSEKLKLKQSNIELYNSFIK